MSTTASVFRKFTEIVGAVGEGITPPVSVSEPDVRLSPHPAPLSESPYGYQLVRHLLA